MRKMLAFSGLALATFGPLCAGSATAKAIYTIVDGWLVAGINSANSVTGYNGKDGFVRTADGTITPFDVPGGSATQGLRINDEGTIAGDYIDSSGVGRGFLRASDGTITTFGVPEAAATQPLAINNNGEIAGRYSDSSNHDHGFLRTVEGNLKTFDVEGAMQTESYSVNDAGVIVGGYYDVQGYEHGFIRASDGTITTFDVLDPNDFTKATQINKNGDIVGTYGDENGEHGFIRAADGTFTTFDDPDCWYLYKGVKAYQTYAEFLNSKGEVAGYCFQVSNGNIRRFIGFLRKTNGSVHEFSAPDHRRGTFVSGLTDAGVISGYFNSPGGYLRFP